MRLVLATLGKWIVYGCLFLLGYATSGLASDRPTVILYTTAGCRPCRLALESLRELGIEPTVTRDCPAWVTQVPVIHWLDRAGVWRQHAPQHWSGPTWSDRETDKLRRWLLPSSATKSTQAGGYLTVTSDSLRDGVFTAEDVAEMERNRLAGIGINTRPLRRVPVADTREAAAPGPKSNQLAGMRPVPTGDILGFCLNDLGKLLREFGESDPRRGFVLTAIHALESI